MALRAALLGLALLLGLSPASAAERAALARPATPVPPDLYPIASDARLGGDASTVLVDARDEAESPSGTMGVAVIESPRFMWPDSAGGAGIPARLRACRLGEQPT